MTLDESSLHLQVLSEVRRILISRYTVTRWHLRERPPYCAALNCLFLTLFFKWTKLRLAGQIFFRADSKLIRITCHRYNSSPKVLGRRVDCVQVFSRLSWEGLWAISLNVMLYYIPRSIKRGLSKTTDLRSSSSSIEKRAKRRDPLVAAFILFTESITVE